MTSWLDLPVSRAPAKKSKRMRRWRIVLIRKRDESIGTVEALDTERRSGRDRAIRDYGPAQAEAASSTADRMDAGR